MATTPDETENPLEELAEELGLAPETPAPSAEPPSAPVSAPSIPEALPDPMSQHLQLLRENIELLMRRVDQQGEVLAGSASRLDETHQTMQDTMSLIHEWLAGAEDHLERLGTAVAAVAEIEQRLTAAVAHLKRQ